MQKKYPPKQGGFFGFLRQKNMSTDNKTLLIHTNTKTEETTAVIVPEHEIVHKTKEFLQKLSRKYKEAQIHVYSPVGVVLQSQDEENAFAVAYERDHFVIVAPNGTQESARLYGNWDEAISNVRQFLLKKCANAEQCAFVLTEYKG